MEFRKTLSLVLLLTLVQHFCAGSILSRPYFSDEEDEIGKVTGLREQIVRRPKRYTDTQERASAYCTGICMFLEQRVYSYCYDLCNWDGSQPSPWKKHNSHSVLSFLKNVVVEMTNGNNQPVMPRDSSRRGNFIGSY